MDSFNDLIAWTDRHVGLAGWMQGVGTLIALSIALWAGGVGARHDRALIRSRNLQFIELLNEALSHIWQAACGPVRTAKEVRQCATRLAEALASVEKLTFGDPVQWPTVRLYFSTVQSLKVLQSAALAYDRLASEIEAMPSNHKRPLAKKLVDALQLQANICWTLDFFWFSLCKARIDFDPRDRTIENPPPFGRLLNQGLAPDSTDPRAAELRPFYCRPPLWKRVAAKFGLIRLLRPQDQLIVVAHPNFDSVAS